MEAVTLAQLAPQPREVPAGNIPGLEDLLAEVNGLLDEQLAVCAAIRRHLRIENRAMRVVGQHRSAAAMERRGLAAVEMELAASVKAESGALLEVFGRLAGLSGPQAELIAQLAVEVRDGGDVNRLVDAEMGRIRAVLAAELQ